MSFDIDRVHILLCGYYFHGNAGDDLMMESIVNTLGKYGEVKVTNVFNYELLDWCDVLVIGGGTLVSKRSLGGHDLALYAKEKGKKIIYYSQTIEEGHPKFKEHLALADLITVRDSASKKIVEANGFRAILASDPIFEKRNRRIGFCFRRWFDEPLGIEDKLASILDNLAVDYEILSLPYTENDTDTESDTAFHNAVIQRMTSKPPYGSFSEAVEKVDLLIGMRLHALIEALNIGKKVIAIDYDAKVGRIFSDLSMEEMIVSYDNLDQIPFLVRNKIFRADGLALREKANEALIAKICADIKGEPSPKVSVVMTTYNRAKHLKESIDSIIKQDMQDWELIIVDDGSTDHTKELVSSYDDLRIKYFNFGHNGENFSRNIGNLISRGDIIVVADTETINLPNRLEVICGEFEKTSADIFYSSMFYLNSDGKMELMPSKPFLYETLKETNFIYHPTVAYRREVAMKCPYNENGEILEDYSMYLQAADKGYKFHPVEERLVMHQLHDRQFIFSKGSGMEKGIAQSSKLTSPMVSVITPTRNRPGFLKEALESILSQTYKNYEIIVIDDGGEDVSEMINSLDHGGRIIYLRHEDSRGPSAARNTGLRVARGKYVAYLDDDDIYYPSHLETLVTFLERNNYKVAYTDSYQASQTWITDRYVITDKMIKYNFDFDRQRFLICNYIHLISIVHKKELLDEVGSFDEKLETHEDWDLCIRLSQKCDFYHIPAATAEFRVRDDMTNAITTKRESLLHTLRQIHKRYSHLVTSSTVFESQKKVERTLENDATINKLHRSAIQYTPLHFYKFAREFVKGKNILDLAFVEGYGDLMLAEEADEVIGVNQDEVILRHASSNYIKGNLKFIKGSITDVPIKGEKIFDVVVCFDAIEHITEHEKLMNEAKRLMKDDGVFIASMYNRYAYSDRHNQNQFYSKGLHFNEFKTLLNKHFKNTFFYGQNIYPSSNIFPLFHSKAVTMNYLIDKSDKEFLFTVPEKKKPLYFISVSSKEPIKDVVDNSYLLDISGTLFKLKDAQIKNLETEKLEKDSHIMNLEGAIKEKDRYIVSLETSVREKENSLKDQYIHIGNLEAGIREKEVHIVELGNNLRENAAALHQIYGSHGWKALLVYYKVRDKMFPSGTRRREFVRFLFRFLLRPPILKKQMHKNSLLYKSLKTLREEGVITFSKKSYRKIKLIIMNKKDRIRLKYLSLRFKKIKNLIRDKNIQIVPIQKNIFKSGIVACTIVSKNFLSYAITLGQSFKSHNPDLDFRILLCDLLEDKEDLALYLHLKNEGLTLVPVYEIRSHVNIPDLEAMLFKYDILEMNTAIKPFFLEYLLKEGYGKVIYFDPDILIMNSMDEIEGLLNDHNIVLTPHILENIPDDGKKQSNLDILVSGVYNLGFIAIKDSEETERFLKWWQEKLIDGCFMDVKKGFHVDQKWVDFVPVLFQKIYIQNKKSYNVAYWNLHEREITFRDRKWYVEDDEIVFFHFSGFMIENLGKISKHQNRFSLKEFPQLRPLFEFYRDELLKNDFINISIKPYHFATLPGTTIKIPGFMRRLYKEILTKWDNPWNPNNVVNICNFVNHEIYPPITRLWLSIYDIRNDLQRAFPLIEDSSENRYKFYDWIQASGKREYGLSNVFINPVHVNSKDYMLNNKLGVNLWGYFENLMGVGELGRYLFGGLQQIGIPLTLFNIPSEYHEKVPFEEIQHLRKYFTEDNIYKINLMCANADALPPIYECFGQNKFKDKYNIGFWAWEIQNYFPFKDSFDLVDEVWSFSDFTCQTYRKYTDKPVIKIPFPFKPNWRYIIKPEMVRKSIGISPEDYVFIFSFDFHSSFERKNPDGIIKAFLNAFSKKDKKVKLIIKALHSQYHPTDHKYIRDFIKHSDENIMYMETDLSREAYISLINASDCFVSLHRSEGLGMGIIEAMYLGKCVIATKYGGNMEFTTSENSLLVDYTLSPIKRDFAPYKKGELWAEPDIDQCVEYMKMVYENREMAKTIGDKGASHFKNISSTACDNIAKRLLEITENILKE